MDTQRKAYLAGGCFWGMEELFRALPGVISTTVGYTGGKNDHPTYDNHPGHAEALEIVYDSSRMSYRDILDFFFRIHDPTTVNRQGNDTGTSYRSAVFYSSSLEKQQAQVMIGVVNASGRWSGQVVTTVEKLTQFWPAEAYHQDYLQKNPDGYTCHYVRFGTYKDQS